MGTYAKGTSVLVERSKGEVERILTRFGASETIFYQNPQFVVIAFHVNKRHFKLTFPRPREADYYGVRALAQAERERWREIVAYLKATLIAVEAGFITIETAFLAHTMLPDGVTVGQWIKEQLDEIADSGAMPPMLPWAGSQQKALPGAGETSK